MLSEAVSVAVRTMQDLDTPLVFSSWLRSYRGAVSTAVGNGVFYRGHHKVIERILADPDTRVMIVHPADDPVTVLGWACRTGGVLHYVYVKEAFRRLGLGTRLAEDFHTYTHLTPYGRYISGVAVYDPYQV